jgi:hypothetical protein
MDTLPDMTAETVGDSAYRRIRTDLIFGKLTPGQKLKLERISGRLWHQHLDAARDAEPAVLGRLRRR